MGCVRICLRTLHGIKDHELKEQFLKMVDLLKVVQYGYLKSSLPILEP